jgi:predicted ATPase
MSRPRSTTSIVLPVMRHSVPRSRFLGARKPRNGYFLRAESFFNIAGFVDGAGKFA